MPYSSNIPGTQALSSHTLLSKRHGHDLLSVEQSIIRNDSQRLTTHVIGSDESGTGCIAGPIVCCSVCIKQSLHDYQALPHVNDGKLLDAATRRDIVNHVMKHPEIYAVAVAIRTSQQIDASSAQTASLDGLRETIESIVDQAKTDECQTFYSIVDGHKSPPRLSIPSRPMLQADAKVYTVALASIVARVTRDNLMLEHSAQYPPYAFGRNGGYSSPMHVQAIHAHGVSPIHRRMTKPVKNRKIGASSGHVIDSDGGMTRRATLTGMTATFAALALQIKPSLTLAMSIDPKTKSSLPDIGEIEASVPTDWSMIDNPFNDNAASKLFGRLDASSDANFYADPRFVEHVDAQAVESMTKYVSDTVAGKDAILDLCTSWTSHIRASNTDEMLLRRVAGLGMNQRELDANAALTERIVQDLNEQPVLPYESNSFVIVLCQLSIDYLTKPLQVCVEIARVLKPGGSVHVIFSNRLFLQKAVAVWTGADDNDHCFIVSSYLHFCRDGLYKDIRAVDLSTRNRSGRIVGDPLYVVTATKAAAAAAS
ncbi:hypothetical protein MPSEU_000192900 [Mayamaea pseudoterrestris]|nr:hypothetical protein MPSEU_000192900 [Mayamaea pseudoterrestris]